jgi:hypothetical protein
MHHMTMAEKSLLIGDRAAALLAEYAALIAKTGSGDAVQIHAYGVDGEEVVATAVLNSGTVLMVESTRSTLPEPDNTLLETYLQGRLDGYTVDGVQSWDDLLPESLE